MLLILACALAGCTGTEIDCKCGRYTVIEGILTIKACAPCPDASILPNPDFSNRVWPDLVVRDLTSVADGPGCELHNLQYHKGGGNNLSGARHNICADRVGNRFWNMNTPLGCGGDAFLGSEKPYYDAVAEVNNRDRLYEVKVLNWDTYDPIVKTFELASNRTEIIEDVHKAAACAYTYRFVTYNANYYTAIQAIFAELFMNNVIPMGDFGAELRTAVGLDGGSPADCPAANFQTTPQIPVCP